ncbi:MAG: SDR family NAD(P)-dependent oxidoreductase [Candidatus Promineifilaceae bacterium]|nr:SDR family NAD(P)-dependent oxidoreductase [Candidatus Promineifilaceae bacterium]
MSLENKVAIVTGAGRGIGAAVAHTLAAAGARVAVNDLNPDRAERVAADIRQSGGEAVGIAADIASKFQCVNLIEATRREWGRLDVLVNNAAVQPQVSILKMDEWAWQRCLDVNLKGTFFMSQLVGRVMADENQDRGGVIVNIASTAGVERALPGRAAYAASKAGVVGFTRECAREFAAFGVRVNSVLPGVIDTLSTEFWQPNKEEDELERIALSRLGQAQEVADAVHFLCSDAGSYMIGSIVTVDGGLMLR